MYHNGTTLVKEQKLSHTVNMLHILKLVRSTLAATIEAQEMTVIRIASIVDQINIIIKHLESGTRSE